MMLGKIVDLRLRIISIFMIVVGCIGIMLPLSGIRGCELGYFLIPSLLFGVLIRNHQFLPLLIASFYCGALCIGIFALAILCVIGYVTISGVDIGGLKFVMAIGIMAMSGPFLYSRNELKRMADEC